MDELTEKLMGLLASKENVERIKNLSGLLLEGKEEQEGQPKEPKSPAESEETSKANDTASLEVLQTIMELMPLLASVNKEDYNTRLLQALRPHLSEHRQAKLDKSIKMLQMLKFLPVLKSQGLF